jgi:uncharacterized coiled-coil DUF342 family protein
LVRPIAWRLRTFFTGEIRHELAQVNDKLQLLDTEIHDDLKQVSDKFQPLHSEIHDDLEQVNDKLQLLRTEIGESRSELTQLNDKLQLLLSRPEKPQELAELQDEVRQFGKMLETTLLTLALEHETPQSDHQECPPAQPCSI